MAKYLFSLISIILVLFSACHEEVTVPEPEQKIIAISKGKGHSSYEAYNDWINRLDSSYLTIDLYYLPQDSVDLILKKCMGLILSGGADINPNYYDYEGDTSLCGTIDGHRDSLELNALEYAIQNNKPILGICRGLQLINVYQGGSLFIDLPTEKEGDVIHRCEAKDACFHSIRNPDQEFLFTICGTNKGQVNSNHHQGILKLGKDLLPIAYSEDSLIEAISWTQNVQHPFMVAVQWHPERMNSRNPYSTSIGRSFIEAVNLTKISNYDK